MNASIIIPTYNGKNKILTLLNSLEQQTYKDFEVIIVIDGSTDNTKELLESHQFYFHSIRIIEQPNQGRSKVRNNGAKHANGELLIFFDDDMTPFKDCVEKHIAHHQKYSNSIVTGGLGEDESQCSSDIQKYKAYLSKKWSLPLIQLSGRPLNKENIFITAANFSISQKLFFELGGFDENLTDVEDYDLAIRAFQAKVPLFYNHEAFAWHNDQITCLSYIKRQREYANMQKKLLLLKPFLYNAFSARVVIMPTGIKAIIFKIFTYKFWIWTVDHFNWLRIFPKRLRYKIYDLIITSNGVYYTSKLALE